MVPDIAQSRITRRQDRSVPQLNGYARTVAEGSVVPVINILSAIRFQFHQPTAVCTYPQVILSIHHHAADPDAGKTSGHRIVDLIHSFQINRVHALVRSDIIGTVPLHYRIGHPVLHARSGIDIPEIRCCQAQQAQPGGSEPQVSLIVHQHVINRVVEIIGVDSFVDTGCINIGNSVVRTDEQPAVIHEMQIFDCHQSRAFDGALQVKPAFADVKPEHLIAGSGGQQISLRIECTAFENRLPLRQLPGGDNLSLLEQKQGSLIRYRYYIPLIISRHLFRIGDF